MSQTFAVLFHVDGRKLATVLEALSGSAQLVSVTPTQAGTSEWVAKPVRATTHYVDGKKNKGISGEDLAAEIVSSVPGRIWGLSEIAQKFIERGFAGHSASPALATASKSGKVRALGNGKYCAPGTVVKMEAK